MLPIKPKPRPGGPGLYKGSTSHKRPFEHSVGRIKYASPVAMPDASRVFKRPYHPPVLTDVERVKRDRMKQLVSEFLLRGMLEHRSISIAVVNETKRRLNQNDLERGLSNMPALMTRAGALYLSYKVRIAKNWLDDIGAMDVVVAVNDDDRANIYDADKPQPFSGYKLNVHIPEQLLSMITSGALSFVEPLDRVMQQDPTLAFYQSRVEQANGQFSWAGALDGTEKGYNARLDLAEAGAKLYQGRKLLGINPRKVNTWNAARSIRKVMKPYYRLDASQLNKQLKWIGSKVGQDVQVLPVLKTPFKALNVAAKELGTLGSVLTLSLVGVKISNDTWTASTVVDGVMVLAGIALAIAGFEAIALVGVAYGAVDLLTGDALSSFWDELFPRNKPFAPPISSFYVNH